MAQAGRKRAVTEEEVIDAIRRWKTTSPSELGEKLNVSRWTIDRRLKKVPQEAIDKIFEELAESELKPAQMQSFDVFKEIPIVAEYEEKMRYKLELSEGVWADRLRTLWQICRILNRKPNNLTVEELADLYVRIKAKQVKIETQRGIITMGKTNFIKCVRSFMQYMKGVSGKLLASEGLGAPAPKISEARARARLTPKQRQAFIRVLKEKVQDNWEGRSGWAKMKIRFKDDPHLAQRMMVLPYAYYYWGNRRDAVLDARIEDMEWKVVDVEAKHKKTGRKVKMSLAIQKLVDKGLHKKGRKTWYKDTTDELLELLENLHRALGEPTEGRWFPFGGTVVGAFFHECYAEAGIPRKLVEGMPVHIWRHTACQDYLDATNRNWELVANRLGWESIDTMKKHYGKASPEVLRKGMLEAMGYEVEWEKREFKF